jgi:hypothetical protein
MSSNTAGFDNAKTPARPAAILFAFLMALGPVAGAAAAPVASCILDNGTCSRGCFVSMGGCEKCIAGTYSDTVDAATSCAKCPTGKYCETGESDANGTGSCESGYWCPEESENKFGKSGAVSENKCAAPYDAGSWGGSHGPNDTGTGGARDENDCFLTTGAGQYVAQAGAGPAECLGGANCTGANPSCGYCVAGVRVYRGGGHDTNGMQQCPGLYPGIDKAQGSAAECYKECPFGRYWHPGTSSCKSCTDNDDPGYCCMGAKIKNGSADASAEQGRTICTNGPGSGSYTGTCISDPASPYYKLCPWKMYSCSTGGVGVYYDQAAQSCYSCPIGYYCPQTAIYNYTHATPSHGKNPCPAGATTSKIGRETINECIMKGGVGGTRFCDKRGCFNLPKDVPY